MRAITDFAQAQSVLRPLYDNHRTKYDLTVMRRLMDYLGNPQEKLRVIHVAGTSGKTSTAYYAAALLKARGLKVGLTVSPHVDQVNERVQLDLVPLPENEFCRELTEFLEAIEGCQIEPSYFEFMVAFAYWEFAKRRVDYAVVEVGLGGLLDGTNIIGRRDKICVITDIGLDHTEILGGTLEEIAAQKAGIIQPGNEVFMYEQGSDVMKVVRHVCQQKQIVLHEIATTAIARQETLPLFQRRNLGLAVQTVNFALQRDSQPGLNHAEIIQAADTLIPARMERYELKGKTLIIDGSHNEQKLTTLLDSIQAAYPGAKIAALAAFVDGPDSRWQGGLAALLPIVNKLIVTSFKAEQDTPKQSVDPIKLQNFCKGQHYDSSMVKPEAAVALQELLNCKEPVLLVAGSFYLLNSIRPLIMKLDD